MIRNELSGELFLNAIILSNDIPNWHEMNNDL